MPSLPRRVALLLSLAFLPTSARALDRVDGIGDGEGRVTWVDGNRMLVSLAAFDPADGRPGSDVRRIAIAMTEEVLLYGFRAELLDANDRALSASGPWRIEIAVARGSLLALDEALDELVVPRPFGLRMRAGDSLIVVGRRPAPIARGELLSLAIDYERPVSRRRLPAVASSVVARWTAVDTASRTVDIEWEWRATTDGRLVSLTLPRIERAVALQVVDLESGDLLWQGPLLLGADAAAPGTGLVLRPDVRVRQGRRYGVRARLHDAPTRDVAPEALLPWAVVRPAVGTQF